MSLLPCDAVANPPPGRGPEPGHRQRHRAQQSPIWQAALNKCYAELEKGGMKVVTIDKEIWSIQSLSELLTQIEGLENAQGPGSPAWTKTLSQLQPVLYGLSDFAALTAWVIGMNGKVAAVLWSSIRLLAKFALPVLPDVVGTLETLQQAHPRLHKYKEELPMTPTLEKALFELYSEIILFCAYAITFFRNNPTAEPKRQAWSTFNTEYSRVISNVRRLSREVDEVARIARLSRQGSTETAAAFDALQGLRIQNNADIKLPCYIIPYGLNLRFFGRSDELGTLSEHLDPSGTSTQLKAIGVHGLGGVGKSQLALQYANLSMDRYALIAWIPSESRIKVVQGLSELANKLGLSENATEDDARSIQKVRDWLNKMKRPFLLIFDNVDSVSVLDQIWPANSMARIILTTRSPSQASKRTPVTLNLAPFSVKSGHDVLQSLTGIGVTDEDEKTAAEGLSHRVGGLPLALAQLSDFIRDRGYSYTEKVYAKSGCPMEYEHTNLSSEAKALQNLLAFLDPDSVLERLLSETKADLEGTECAFLLDEFDFGDVVMELTRTSMIGRLSTSKSISMHRLVQLAVLSRLPAHDRVAVFDLAVEILYFDFPNTWHSPGAHQGHGFASWETCSAILPIYLWEKEQPSLARSMFEFGLGVDNLPKPLAAQAHRLLGHINLDLARPRAALAAYSQTLSIRTELEPPESPPIADILDSLACSNVEIGDMSRTLAIRAMQRLRAGDADGALDALGRQTEAKELVSRSIVMRKQAFGQAGGPRVADSLFTLARMLDESGEHVLAARALREVVDMCDRDDGAPVMRPHLARALWFLANVEERLRDDGKAGAEILRARARDLRGRVEEREWEDEDSDEGFSRLVGWMLW
ncbi:tpr repeat-containing protein [Immersiella caudata]|uniref:Tpr repeat-containing protein n=1 Tax=Immersiella caudata TaxID=314043 RepID=A0AA39WJL2_9PEZI|nr:tpr repeat-containing protein [Immersiella caudata]